MNKIIAGIAVALGMYLLANIYVGFRYGARTAASSSPSATSVQKVQESPFKPQTILGGNVSVTVTPRQLRGGVQDWEFAVTLETHSVELNDDLRQVSLLVDQTGKEYKPEAWDGDPPGGHHRSGRLRFKAITPPPSAVRLKILRVGGVPERSFEWNLGA